MIAIGENKSVICKGDFHPAELYKGDKKIAGYTVTEFEGEGSVSLTDCYNDKVYDFVQNSSAGSITVRGKNILDMSKHTLSVGYYLDSSGNGSSNGVSGRMIKISPIAVTPSTTYTITSNLYFYSIWCVSGGDNTGIKKIIRYGRRMITFTTPEDCNYIRVSFDLNVSNQTGEGISAFEWAMLEIGEGGGAYEPYIEPQTISVENGEITADIPTFRGTTVIEVESEAAATISGKYKKVEE